MEGQERAAAKVRIALGTTVGQLYPIFIFYGLYAAVVYLYDWLQPFKPLSANVANLIQFVTSPFSFIEAAPPYSSSTIVGLYNNFLFVAMVLVFAAMYELILSKRFKRQLSVPRVFGAGVIGTYLVSAGVWALTGQPSTGTSIVGFTTAAAVSIASGADLLGQIQQIYRGNGMPKEYAKAYVLLVVFGISSLIAIRSYIFGNPSYLLHLAGAATSGITLFFSRPKASLLGIQQIL